MADKEYIERGALVKRLWASPLFDNITKNGLLIKAGVIDLVKRQPAADVVEVRHGEWVREREKCGDVVCSECRSVCHLEMKGDDSSDWDWVRSNYCPKCGAKMDGGSGNG